MLQRRLHQPTHRGGWFGTDRHHVYGPIVNWGDESAYDVRVQMTWNLGGGKYVYKTYYIEIMLKHQINYIDVAYRFDGSGSFSYYVEWS